MEHSLLNIILVLSFAFVSIALGIRWLGQIIIEYKLAKIGMMLERKKDFTQIMVEEEDDK